MRGNTPRARRVNHIPSSAGALPTPQRLSSPPAAPLLSDPQWRGDRFEFWVKGATGYSGRVESSSDGRTWTLFSEIEFGNEPVLITGPLGDSVSYRLFRVTIGDAVP